jgi:hypothetical protein
MLFVGDDWAEDHHDIEIVDEDGRRLVQRRLPEGLDGVSRVHALIAAAMPPGWADLEPVEAAARALARSRGSTEAAGPRSARFRPMSSRPKPWPGRPCPAWPVNTASHVRPRTCICVKAVRFSSTKVGRGSAG